MKPRILSDVQFVHPSSHWHTSIASAASCKSLCTKHHKGEATFEHRNEDCYPPLSKAFEEDPPFFPEGS